MVRVQLFAIFNERSYFGPFICLIPWQMEKEYEPLGSQMLIWIRKQVKFPKLGLGDPALFPTGQDLAFGDWPPLGDFVRKSGHYVRVVLG